ncbi:hypothetical protein Tco_0430826, partial [Tanacetum coccineum]
SLMLNQRQGEGWICFGDFNEILYAFEKYEMISFLYACNMCNLEDMDATSVKFTWSNSRQGCDNVKKRLDSNMEATKSGTVALGGDKNTRFFHTRATSRNKRNSILRLKDEDGRWVENADHVCDLVSAYFSNLFSSSSPQDCDSVVESIDQRLTGHDILSEALQYWAHLHKIVCMSEALQYWARFVRKSRK